MYLSSFQFFKNSVTFATVSVLAASQSCSLVAGRPRIWQCVYNIQYVDYCDIIDVKSYLVMVWVALPKLETEVVFHGRTLDLVGSLAALHHCGYTKEVPLLLSHLGSHITEYWGRIQMDDHSN